MLLSQHPSGLVATHGSTNGAIYGSESRGNNMIPARPDSAPPSQHARIESRGQMTGSLTPSAMNSEQLAIAPVSSEAEDLRRGRASIRRSSFRRLKKAGSALLRSARSGSKIAADVPQNDDVSAHSSFSSSAISTTASSAIAAEEASPANAAHRDRSATFAGSSTFTRTSTLASNSSNASPRGSAQSSTSSSLYAPHSPLTTDRVSLSSSSTTEQGALSDSMSVSSQCSPSRRIPQAPGLVGIANHGNTCFMNAVVQCLSNTEPLCRYFTLDSYKLSRTRRPQLGQRRNSKAVPLRENAPAQPGAVTDRLALLLKSMWSHEYEQSVSERFCQAVGAANERYRQQTQQDAHEFLIWLLNTMDSDLQGDHSKRMSILGLGALMRRKSITARSEAVTTSYIQNLFMGMSTSTLKCSCGFVSRSPDPFMCLSLPLPGNHCVRKVLVQIIFRSHARRPLQLGLLVPKLGESEDTVMSLLKEICGKTSMTASHIVLCSLQAHSFGRYHLSTESVDTLGELVFAFETPRFTPSAAVSSQHMQSFSLSLHERETPQRRDGSDTVFASTPQSGVALDDSLTSTRTGVFLPSESEIRQEGQFGDANNAAALPATGGSYTDFTDVVSTLTSTPEHAVATQRSGRALTVAGGDANTGHMSTSSSLGYVNLPPASGGSQGNWQADLHSTATAQGIEVDDSDATSRANNESTSSSSPPSMTAMFVPASPSTAVQPDVRAANAGASTAAQVTVVIQGCSPQVNRRGGGGDGGEDGGGRGDDTDYDSAFGSLCDGSDAMATINTASTTTPSRAPTTATATYVNVPDGDRAPATVPRSTVSLAKHETLGSAASQSSSTSSFVRQRRPHKIAMEKVAGESVLVGGGLAGGDPRDSMQDNRMYHHHVAGSVGSVDVAGAMRISAVARESLLVLVLLVEGSAHAGTRFGSPMVLRVHRDIQYIQLHSLIVKNMQRYLDKPLSKKLRNTPMFRMRIQGGHPGQSYLSPDDAEPLYSKTVDVALRSLPEDISQKHVRIITEWTPQNRKKLCLLAEEMPDVHNTVRDVEDSILKQQRCSLSDCLSKYTQSEQLYGESAWKCPRCERRSNGTAKRLSLSALPKVLVVHIKRFQHVGKHHIKADTFMDFPVDLLDMQPYSDIKASPRPLPKLPHGGAGDGSSQHSGTLARVPPPLPEKLKFMDRPASVRATAIRYVNIEAIETNSGVPSTKYKLIGVVNHAGRLNRGHYMAACRSSLTNHWYTFDDSKVVPIVQEEVVTRDAFILVYQRLDLLQPVSPHDWIKQIDVRDLHVDQRRGSSTTTTGGGGGSATASPARNHLRAHHQQHSVTSPSPSKASVTSSTTTAARASAATPSSDHRSVEHFIPDLGDALDLAAASVLLPQQQVLGDGAAEGEDARERKQPSEEPPQRQSERQQQQQQPQQLHDGPEQQLQLQHHRRAEHHRRRRSVPLTETAL